MSVEVSQVSVIKAMSMCCSARTFEAQDFFLTLVAFHKSMFN